MSLPPRVTRIDKNGVRFEESVDRIRYELSELKRAALRDVGIFVCRTFRKTFYSTFKRRSGKSRATQYWARKREGDLQVGWKPVRGFHHGMQETGTEYIAQKRLLYGVVYDNIPTIISIMSQYLSALEDDAAVLSRISEEEYEGGEDEG